MPAEGIAEEVETPAQLLARLLDTLLVPLRVRLAPALRSCASSMVVGGMKELSQ